MSRVLLDLPADLGSIVYIVYDRCTADTSNCPYNGGYGLSRCGKGKEHCGPYYEPVTFTLDFYFSNKNKHNIYLTEQEAYDKVLELNTIYNKSSLQGIDINEMSY
jgi:hypothetical protein